MLLVTVFATASQIAYHCQLGYLKLHHKVMLRLS